MEAISHISNYYIVEYSVVKPILKEPLDSVLRRKRLLKTCACIMLMIVGITLAINFIPQKKQIRMGSLMAYATVEGGDDADIEMTEADNGIPLSLARTVYGDEGFLFSIVVDEATTAKIINIIDKGKVVQENIADFPIEGVKYKKGRIYFFIPCEVGEVSFSGIDDKEGCRYDVTIIIIEQDERYFAKLQALTCYPRYKK